VGLALNAAIVIGFLIASATPRSAGSASSEQEQRRVIGTSLCEMPKPLPPCPMWSPPP
jgi:hypothetical protein